MVGQPGTLMIDLAMHIYRYAYSRMALLEVILGVNLVFTTAVYQTISGLLHDHTRYCARRHGPKRHYEGSKRDMHE